MTQESGPSQGKSLVEDKGHEETRGQEGILQEVPDLEEVLANPAFVWQQAKQLVEAETPHSEGERVVRRSGAKVRLNGSGGTVAIGDKTFNVVFNSDGSYRIGDRVFDPIQDLQPGQWGHSGGGGGGSRQGTKGQKPSPVWNPSRRRDPGVPWRDSDIPPEARLRLNPEHHKGFWELPGAVGGGSKRKSPPPQKTAQPVGKKDKKDKTKKDGGRGGSRKGGR